MGGNIVGMVVYYNLGQAHRAILIFEKSIPCKKKYLVRFRGHFIQ